MASQTDYGGLLIGVGVLAAGYFAWRSGVFNQLGAQLQQATTPVPPTAPGINPLTGQPYGYCQDGSTPNPNTGLCANGAAPTTVPVPTQTGYPYPGQQQAPCYGQNMYTGQPCACPPPGTTAYTMPQDPSCNCQNCGATGYGQQSPYGSPYGTSPYGTSPYGQQYPYGQQSPYGSQYPYGSPYGQPSQYPYGQGGMGGMPGYPGTAAPYGSPYGMTSPYTYPGSPYGPMPMPGYPSPYPSPYSPYPPIAAAPVPVPVPIPVSTRHRFGYAGTGDLNSFAGKAIAADGYGV